MASTPPPQCAVVLVLAHLLRQHSLSYDDEKNALLDASVRRATELAHVGVREGGVGGGTATGAADAAGEAEPEGEVHVVLTGSPRPTFAETNAWLLEGHPPATPRRAGSNANTATPTRADNDGTDAAAGTGAAAAGGGVEEGGAERQHSTPQSFRGSYSILDNNVEPMAEDDEMSVDDENNNDGVNPQEYMAQLDTENSENKGGNPTEPNNYARQESTGSSAGPMVGHAVVNAVSQQRGVGLRSSRAKLLQGTIDRPLWDQRRWTDGECLFSELVDKCGLESFENVGHSGSHLGQPPGGGVGADAAAGGGARPSNNLGETGGRLQKTTNLSAHLITVPATIDAQTAAAEEVPGMAEDVTEEIARGILRCLKRKKSPPASKVYIALPPDATGEDEECRRVVVRRLAAAWQKLERYNDMIGAPRLMADAVFEFLDVSV